MDANSVHACSHVKIPASSSASFSSSDIGGFANFPRKTKEDERNETEGVKKNEGKKAGRCGEEIGYTVRLQLTRKNGPIFRCMLDLFLTE